MELLQGAPIGNRYKVIGCLGSGDTGQVFLARDLSQRDEVVALKVFNQGTFKSKPIKDHFIQGLELSKRINSPFSIKPIEFLDTPELTALSMEYVRGSDLGSILEERPVSLGEILQILILTARELAKLHQAGAVHNDISPAQIFITESGELKLGGIPQLIGKPKRGNILLNLRVGSAHYKAPEFLKAGVLDERSDIFSLGVLGRELLERCQFGREEGKRAVALEAALERAVSCDPDSRFSSVEELCVRFEEALGIASTKQFSGTVFLVVSSILIGGAMLLLPLISQFLGIS